MVERDDRPPNLDDLVFFEPRVTDGRAFTVGLWSAEVVLSAAVLAAVVLRGRLGDTANVLVASVIMLWFVADYAIVLRGRLQPRPSRVTQAVAVVASLVLAAWIAVFAGVLAGTTTRDAKLIVASAVGLVVWLGWLIAIYRARMFRWR